jgi:hypothetical protein
MINPGYIFIFLKFAGDKSAPETPLLQRSKCWKILSRHRQLRQTSLMFTELLIKLQVLNYKFPSVAQYRKKGMDELHIFASLSLPQPTKSRILIAAIIKITDFNDSKTYLFIKVKLSQFNLQPNFCKLSML